MKRKVGTAKLLHGADLEKVSIFSQDRKPRTAQDTAAVGTDRRSGEGEDVRHRGVSESHTGPKSKSQ